MLWELYQFSRIHQAQSSADSALGSARRAESDVNAMQRDLRGLEQQVERLTLATIATIEILRDRYGISEQELEAKVREIDLRDGKLDGKLQQAPRAPSNCPACARPNAPTRAACLYCGAPLPTAPIVPPLPGRAPGASG